MNRSEHALQMRITLLEVLAPDSRCGEVQAMTCSGCGRDVVATVVLVHQPRRGGRSVEWHLCCACFAPERVTDRGRRP